MFRYRLRTLMVLLAIGPPVLAALWWSIRTGAIHNLPDAVQYLAEFLATLAGVCAVMGGIAYAMARFAAYVTKR